MAGGAKLLGELVAERGKGVGARRVGQGGGVRGWNLYLNEVFYKTGIVTSDYGVVTNVTTQNRTRNHGNPRFWGNPHVMTSRSRKHIIISPKKSENEMCKRFQLIIYVRRSSHLGKLAHFKFLNSNISVFSHDFKPKIEISTDFNVI